MAEINPYETPDSDVQADDVGAVYQPGFFVTSTIGRIRYLAYNTLMSLGLIAILGVLFGTIGAISNSTSSGELTNVVSAVFIVAYIAIFIYAIALARRRLNDLNLTGWIALAFLVPIANFILGLGLALWPGNKGPNRYGPAPNPNGTALWVLGLILPIILVGILAATAIPAYQDYLEQSQAAANSE